jgi:ketosteroid isomerase-like protein
VGARELPPVAVVLSFIDRVNHGDVEGLGRLMTEDHTLEVLDETPLRGRAANVQAWRGYVTSFPAYVIYPRRISEPAGRVAVLGHTTGSHLGLPDEQERELTLIWVATVAGGRVSGWRLLEDTAELRRDLGLDQV